jgi:hypothetical protein
VYVAGMDNTIYVEMMRGDGLNRPYRHLIWRLSKVKGVWHVQSHEFRRSKGLIPSAVGLWAAPGVFPVLSADDLVATMDIPLKAEGGKYSGSTPVPYATSVGGAVEMTSAITLAADRIEVADRGFDASGKQVWGPAEGQSYAFAKTDLGVKGVVNSNGLATVTYPTELTGPESKDGDLISVHYIGYLENGTIFDSSYERNQPFQYAKGSKLIEGWTLAMADARAGMKRRVIIPSALGYGERGSRGKVPPFATLIRVSETNTQHRFSDKGLPKHRASAVQERVRLCAGFGLLMKSIRLSSGFPKQLASAVQGVCACALARCLRTLDEIYLVCIRIPKTARQRSARAVFGLLTVVASNSK